MQNLLRVMGLASLVWLAGCSVNQDFVRGVDGYTRVILPDYKTYVKNDAALAEDTKRIRLQAADKLQELVDSAKEK